MITRIVGLRMALTCSRRACTSLAWRAMSPSKIILPAGAVCEVDVALSLGKRVNECKLKYVKIISEGSMVKKVTA